MILYVWMLVTVFAAWFDVVGAALAMMWAMGIGYMIYGEFDVPCEKARSVRGAETGRD